MNMPRIIFMLFLILVFALAACSPTIGNRVKLQDVQFEVGKTTKKEIADALGFPAAIQKDEELSAEFWAYHDKPELTGVMWAAPTQVSSSGITVSTFETAFAQQPKEFQDAALICVFDSSGILTDLKCKP